MSAAFPRPIGTEFERVDYPSPRDLNTYWATKSRWRVVGHSDGVSPDGVKVKLESVEIVASVRSPRRDFFPVVNGSLVLDWGLSVALGLQPPPEFPPFPSDETSASPSPLAQTSRPDHG